MSRQPGQSAQDRYEARSQGRRGILARLGPEPQHVKAWKLGAEAERRVAGMLAKRLNGKDVRLLHDLRLPGRQANIDHVAIGPAGVTVIDTKNISGTIRVQRRGGAFGPVSETLLVGRRNRTKLVAGVEAQVELMRHLFLGGELDGVRVRGALCIAKPSGLPLLGKLSVRGVRIDGTRGVAKLVAERGPLDSGEIHRVASLIQRHFCG